MPSLFPETESPASTWITAHCDGGARGNPGPAGYGAVVTDAAGHTLAELSDFLGVRSNNVAEYAGLLACLTWALENDHPRLRVVSDSLLMVNQIKGKFKVNSPDLRPLFEEARRRIARLDRFEISHALRHKNKDADRLANEAMDRGMGRDTHRTAAPPPLKPAAATPAAATPAPVKPSVMLRGFTRDGSIHLLGGTALPDGVFVKIIPE